MDPSAIVSTATETALQCGGAVVTRHVGYLSHYSDKLKEMKHIVEMLEGARNRVKNAVTEAKMNGEEIEDDVQHWLKQVDEKIEEYRGFLGDGHHAKTKCSIGFFPYNLSLRYRLGRQAAKLAEDSKAEELWNKKFDRVSYRTRPSMDDAFSNLGYESFESRNETVDKIMQALEDSTVSMIGLYGVGGVGKTTLANEVSKKVKENKMFNIVIMVSITKNPDIKKVQGQIAEMLGMRLEEESEIVRADRLKKGLKIEKENTLIILDDLWDRLDLNRLGIPSSLDDDDDSKMEKGKLSGYGKGYKILLKVVPSDIISRMYSLEELYMRDTLFPWEDEQRIQSENASLSELRHLNQLRALEIHIPSVIHFPQNLFFDKLDSYKIFIGEFNLLSAGAFKMPDKYEALKFLALNLKEGMDIHSQKWVKMLFKRVQSLLLGELNSVRDVFYELNVEGFPDLKHLSIVNNFGIQYIINSLEQLHPLQAFPKLESMSLYKMDNLEKICDNQLTGDSFSKLKIIKIKACGKLGNLFTFAMLKLLTMLETVDVCDCDSLKEIVSVERQAHSISDCDSLKEIVSVERQAHSISDVKDDTIEFPQLRFLTLQSLPSFICLYTSNKIPSISQDQVPNKESEITKIVGQGFSLFNEKVSIPKLEWLELSSIHIQKIWSDQCLHCFQNLLTLNVTDCADLKYLLSLSMAGNLVNLQSLFISGCGMMENIIRIDEDDAMPIDIFRKLKKMEIICMENLNTLWHPHIGLNSFHSLDSLIVRDCTKLVTIFPSYVGHIFQRIKSLEVARCQSVESIFDFINIPQTNGRDETNLHSLTLQELQNLVQVWKGDTRILKYNNLQNINIEFCSNLEYLFPLSVASGLEKLEFLKVYRCRGMKEVVSWDKRSNEQSITFKFPHLNTLSFGYLYHLKNFYPGIHTLEWPSLKRLEIFFCSNLEALSTKTPNSQMKPIFSATEKVLYNLELMAMSLKEANNLHNYTVSVQSMHKLQSLVLNGLENNENLFWFLHRLPNLESLILVSCDFKKIWGPASLVAHEKIGVVVQLKELSLYGMFQLDEIGFEHDPLLQRIERLYISRCSKMTSLAPSSVSFCYLTQLEVSDCTGLKYLITSSTARSLVQLTTMKVDSCEMVVEIVAENENEDGKEIEFKQLKALELASLKNLTSFCRSKKCDFKFPLLENLVVNHCPQMTYFTKVQSAPSLQKVHVVAEEKDRWYWEGDLNGTIRKISMEDQVHIRLFINRRMLASSVFHLNRNFHK